MSEEPRLVRRRRRLHNTVFGEMAGGPADLMVTSTGDKMMLIIGSRKPDKRPYSHEFTLSHKEVIFLLGALYEAARRSERSEEWRKSLGNMTDHEWYEWVPEDVAREDIK